MNGGRGGGGGRRGKIMSGAGGGGSGKDKLLKPDELADELAAGGSDGAIDKSTVVLLFFSLGFGKGSAGNDAGSTPMRSAVFVWQSPAP